MIGVKGAPCCFLDDLMAPDALIWLVVELMIYPFGPNSGAYILPQLSRAFQKSPSTAPLGRYIIDVAHLFPYPGRRKFAS
jgi:hypothetical protein